LLNNPDYEQVIVVVRKNKVKIDEWQEMQESL
jgi:hypothetical protein